jgi:hypothetical protein
MWGKMIKQTILMDIIENIKGSVIQHGSHNNRIYLMRLKTDDAHSLIAALDDMATKYELP